MFPYHLSQLHHLRQDKRIKFKQESVNFDEQEFKFTIVSYMISDNTLWKEQFAEECRGITFDNNGECVSVGFEKFFNYMENEKTQPACFDNENYAQVQDKRDGSMITGVLLSTGHSKKVILKTKKSFYSNVAVEAQNVMPQNVENLFKFCLESKLSPIFEFTSKMNEIVIDYGDEPKFTLLAIRDIATGEYLSRTKCESICNNFNVDIVEQYEVPFRDILEYGSTKENVEGWVIWFQKPGNVFKIGQRIKLKTSWYLKRHHAKTLLRVRDIADMVIDETIDDMKSFISSLGYNLSVINEIEERVNYELVSIMNLVDDLYQAVKDKDRKEVAIRYKDAPHFGMLMKKFAGGEPDYKKFWIKNFRDGYSLNTIFSTFLDENA